MSLSGVDAIPAEFPDDPRLGAYTGSSRSAYEIFLFVDVFFSLAVHSDGFWVRGER